VLLNKPSASRQESSELYIVCLNFKQWEYSKRN
jgi:23S rRNA U2552 (ribose-2'-O)-methylase RlmE/FtsJ